MANIRREYGSILRTGANNLQDQVIGLDTNQWMTGNLNKAWRAQILINRRRQSTLQDTSTDTSTDPASEHKFIAKREDRATKRKIVEFNSTNLNLEAKAQESIDKRSRLYSGKKPNKVIIYNLSKSPYQYIELQVRPKSLDFKGETTWASVKSMGRNTPMYHYTGAEDTLQFNTSWYRTDSDNLDEVVNKCRLLEAWSKADGYRAAPPVLMIQWGDDEQDSLFKDHYYILISATYTLRDFNDTSRVWDSGNNRLGNVLVDGKLYPLAATQELIFKRVSSTNIGYNDILPEAKMNRTRGIKNI